MIPERIIIVSRGITVQSCVSSSNFLYTLFYLWSSSSCIRLLPHLPVTVFPIFLSITCFRRQFLHKTWPNQSAFLHFIVCRIFFSSFTLCNTVPFLVLFVIMIFSILLQHYAKLCFKCSTLLVSFLNLSPIFLLKADFVTAIMDLISCVHLDGWMDGRMRACMYVRVCVCVYV